MTHNALQQIPHGPCLILSLVEMAEIDLHLQLKASGRQLCNNNNTVLFTVNCNNKSGAATLYHVLYIRTAEDEERKHTHTNNLNWNTLDLLWHRTPFSSLLLLQHDLFFYSWPIFTIIYTLSPLSVPSFLFFPPFYVIFSSFLSSVVFPSIFTSSCLITGSTPPLCVSIFKH